METGDMPEDAEVSTHASVRRRLSSKSVYLGGGQFQLTPP